VTIGPAIGLAPVDLKSQYSSTTFCLRLTYYKILFNQKDKHSCRQICHSDNSVFESITNARSIASSAHRAAPKTTFSASCHDVDRQQHKLADANGRLHSAEGPSNFCSKLNCASAHHFGSKITEALQPTILRIHNDSHLHSHHKAMVDNKSSETHFRCVESRTPLSGSISRWLLR
jgi:hypothetical protein